MSAASAASAKTAAETAQSAAETAQSAAESAETAAAGSASSAAGSAAEAAAILEEFTTPTASAETLEPGSQASASYSSGHFTFGLPTGEKGDTGNDGVSPTVAVTTIAGGHRVTVTDAQGTRYFDVLDGEGSGDMIAAVYDANSAVASAGGIAAYVAAHAPQGLFYCTYGTTTFAQITAALDAGQFPVCIYNDRFYSYVGISNGYHCFTAVVSTTAYRLYVKNTWGSASFNVAQASQIPTALEDLTEDSTHRTVTDAEKAAWNAKQDAISDLPTIRSGAALGATAVQTETDPTVPSWAKQTSKPSYTASEVGAVPTTRKVNNKALSSDITLSASDVGADASGTAASAVSTHNSSASAHSALFAAKASTATYTASVTTGWTQSGSYCTKTVSVSGILAADNPIADVVLGSDADANALYLEAWGMVQRIVTAANSITLYATANPQSAFTIQMKVVR